MTDDRLQNLKRTNTNTISRLCSRRNRSVLRLAGQDGAANAVEIIAGAAISGFAGENG